MCSLYCIYISQNRKTTSGSRSRKFTDEQEATKINMVIANIAITLRNIYRQCPFPKH